MRARNVVALLVLAVLAGVAGWMLSSREHAGARAALAVDVPRPAPQRTSAREPFSLGAARGCEWTMLEPYLAERTGDVRSALAADVLVLRVQVRCEEGQSQLETARWLWLPEGGGEEAFVASEATSTPKAPEGVLQRAFEVPRDRELSRGGPFGELRLRSPFGDLDVRLDGPATPGAATPQAEPANEDRCQSQRAKLRAELAERFAAAPEGGPECNVMGWLVPERCPDLRESPLLDRVLSVRRSCNEPLVRTLMRKGEGPAPEDFRIAFRRDRCPGSLDTCPRYTLAIYGNGVTVFHGEHFVNALGRSDGRASPRLVAGLWQTVEALELLTRRGGHVGQDDACSARGSDEGALLTLAGRGRSRMIVDRDGCRGPFSAEDMARVEAAMDAVAGVGAWTSPPPAYADREVRVWKVDLAAQDSDDVAASGPAR